MTQSEELIRGMQKGLLQWYDFESAAGEGCVLYTGSRGEPVAELLEERALQLVCVPCGQTCQEGWQREWEGKFDYIVSIEELELQPDPERFLRAWKSLLKPEGRMLLGMNNRFGIRYFCGDKDPYTERNFDGIENYRRAYSKKEDHFQGRMYSRAELERMLHAGGWEHVKFYSVFSDLRNPSLIYEESYLPNEDLANRVFPAYHCPDTVFLEEEGMYAGLAENGMFHQMANAYLMECPVNGKYADVLHVTGSMDRGREAALFTVIRKSGRVEKRAPYPEGRERLERVTKHGRELAERGVPVVETRMENGCCVMPYVNEEVGQVFLKRLLQEDREEFLRKMDHFRDLILQSSEILEPDQGDGQGALLRKGYLDMVPLNSFYKEGTFLFYDQEFCQENCPANAIIARMVNTFYSGNIELQKLLPMEALYERYGLKRYTDRWMSMESAFLTDLRKERELRAYHEKCRRNAETVNSNRQRMNYSEEEYQRLFVDIFRNADTRKLILFGSGMFARKFLALYGQDYPVYAIIDNNADKWGGNLDGISIQSPDMLGELQSGEYKVLICIKNYLSVMRQLNDLGVSEYSIYDSHKDYPRKRNPIVPRGTAEEGDAFPHSGHGGQGAAAKKKYHVGYIAGVFDLFHVGHLNMFKRAKEQCDYLIVGVVTDEGVRKYKKVEPFISFEERIEMVRSCRYVDEAVEIPFNYRGTRDAWRLYHFDCQFSGSDYVDNPDWLAEKAFLEKHGADLVFFPYTETTSSTRIKGLIEKKLI